MKTAKDYNYKKLSDLLNVDPEHPHIHAVDMPYRITSIWQDHDCDIGIWENASQVAARAKLMKLIFRGQKIKFWKPKQLSMMQGF